MAHRKRSKNLSEAAKQRKQINAELASGTILPPPKGGYPSPAEHEQILERRSLIMREMIEVMVRATGGYQQKRFVNFINQYGERDTTVVRAALQRGFQRPDFLTEEVWIYRQYRQAYARFGGQRHFLSRPEYEDLTAENGKLCLGRLLLPYKVKPSARERELSNLLITPHAFWEDITPPADSPRPADFNAPPADYYAAPVSELLAWGWDLNPKVIKQKTGNLKHWAPWADDLARMTFDEGLLNGWPGEAASWAPYHALELLGMLKAHPWAANLCSLVDRENDWLSDRLPEVWANMGTEVEKALWPEIEDRSRSKPRRKLALSGLRSLAERYPARRLAIVNRLAVLLAASTKEEANFNGCIVFVLERLEAV